MPGYCEVRNPHTVGFITILRASIKRVLLWELLAYILNIYSIYRSAYIAKAGVAWLVQAAKEVLDFRIHRFKTMEQLKRRWKRKVDLELAEKPHRSITPPLFYP